MVKYLVALLAFDFDGTLFDEETQTLPETTLAVLQKLYLQHHIVLITGRWEIQPQYLLRIPHHARATNNGGRILLGDTEHSSHYLPPEDIQTVLEHAPPEGNVVAFSPRFLFSSHPQAERFIQWREQLETAPLAEAVHHPILKINISNPRVPQIKGILQNHLPHVTFSGGQPPYPHFLTLTPQQANKGDALITLARELGFSLADTVVFGDSDNDIDMLKHAGKAVQVGNAPYLQPLAHARVESPWHLAAWLEEHV